MKLGGPGMVPPGTAYFMPISIQSRACGHHDDVNADDTSLQ